METKKKTPKTTKTLSEKIEKLLTPEGIMLVCFIGFVLVILGNFAWLGIAKLFGLH